MRLRGRLTYHLSLHTRATVLRLWARAIENMPYIRVEDLVGVGDLFARVAEYLREFFDDATATDLLNRKDVGKELTDDAIVSEELAYAAIKALADIETVLDSFDRTADYERAFTETGTVADVSILTPEKVIADIVDQYNETVTRAFNKGLTDTASGVETVSRNATKTRSDTPIVTDVARRTTGKGLIDLPKATESMTRSFSKQATTDRVQSFSELVAKSIIRVRTDSVSTVESVVRTFEYGRAFIEGGLYAEPGYFADNYVAKDLEPIDVFRFAANKAYSDETTAADNLSRVYTGARNAIDALSVLDARDQSITKPFSETLTLSENISLALFKPIIEDARYAEDGYFADNYVSAGLVPADSITVTLNP